MKIVGCDLHARQQTIAMVDTETGEFVERALSHEGNALREFYGALEGPVVWASKPRDPCSGSWNCCKSSTDVFLGDPSRFDTANQVASYIGMIPCEHTSGKRQRL